VLHADSDRHTDGLIPGARRARARAAVNRQGRSIWLRARGIDNLA
jgi:hypothetical protein